METWCGRRKEEEEEKSSSCSKKKAHQSPFTAVITCVFWMLYYKMGTQTSTSHHQEKQDWSCGKITVSGAQRAYGP